MDLLKVKFSTTDLIPEFDAKYEGYFVLDENEDLYLGLKDKWKQISMGKSSNLELGEGLVKNVYPDKISISIDEEYIKKKIDSYIENFVDSNWGENTENEAFDVLKKTVKYIIDDENYNWYNFANINEGIIILDELMDVPLNPANFGDKYIPSFTMEFDSFLDLTKTPIFEIEGFTLNKSAFNFKFVDANGKCSTPLICGKAEDGNSKVYVVNPSSHQERSNSRIIAMGVAGYSEYTDATTKETIDSAISSLVQEYIDNGSYNSSKCAKAKLNILTDTEDELTFEEGFDKTKISKLCVQLVENYDKESLQWKSRYKAQIFNKLQFSKVEETI